MAVTTEIVQRMLNVCAGF